MLLKKRFWAGNITSRKCKGNIWNEKIANHISEKNRKNLYNSLTKCNDYKLNRWITWTFFQWRYQIGQYIYIYIYENVHNITNHDMQCMSGKCITEPNELFTPILTAIIKNLGNKYWWWCGEKGFFVHCGWERKLVQLQ